MKIILLLLFALIAAIGNALYALAQKRAANFSNGMLFVACAVGIAMLLAWCSALIVSPVDLASLVRLQWKNVLMGGIGLFGVYIGFYLMFTRYGVSSYILYAVLSILTTTVVVGILWLREPINGLRIASIVLATAAVVLYSLSETSHG